jgi:NTP pyrophosphatase (non-canonical NTP hydrolase)
MMISFNDYQAATDRTAKYPQDEALNYLTLGLASEAGEVAGRIKKVIRDKNSIVDAAEAKEIGKELGDVLWYVAQLALCLNITLESIAVDNLAKLSDRAERGVIGGDGDNR